MTKDLAADLTSLSRLLPPLSRRGFVATAGAAVSFAAAAGPLAAQTVIETDREGLEEGMVAVPTEDGEEMPAYFAQPEGKGAAPLILVVQEIFGLHEYIQDVCRRLAKEGYFAIAPALYFRKGDPSSYENVQTLLQEVVSQIADEQVMSDLDTTLAWAREQGADRGRLGITGFCWGGRITWLYTAHNPEVDAGVAWYGRLVGEESERTPRHPIHAADDLKGPVLGLYGGADSGIPVETVEQMQAALAEGGEAARASKIIVYPDAPHAFHADYRPSYREVAAQDGWRRLITWFDAHL